MKSITRGHLKAGLDSMRGSKMRNFWTMLGIIIAVASVITIVGIGQGVKQQIAGQVSRYGKDVITIRPSSLQTGSGNSSANLNLLAGLSVTGSLNGNDVNAVTKTAGVGASAPLSAVTGDVKGDQGVYKNGLVIGTTPDLPSLINQSLAYGVFLNQDDSDLNGAVLGSDAASALFNVDVPLGHSFTIHGQEFVVRGIFNQFPSTPLSDEGNFNSAIFISYNSAQRLTKDTAVTYEILAKPTKPSALDQTVASLRNNLKQSRGGQTNFSVLRADQAVNARSSVLDLLTSLIGGVAAISLLVGGIGIMNVMLVSVTERMHEIGIRKAIGATNRQILSQFIIESSVLSLSGGAIGIIVAFIFDGLLRFFTNLRPIISWQVVLLATGISLLVGIIFGSIPALQAARKDPIEALRSQ